MGQVPPIFTNDWARGHPEKNSKQETDQTVLTITKALTKKPKEPKSGRARPKIFFPMLRRIGAPICKFVPARHLGGSGVPLNFFWIYFTL